MDVGQVKGTKEKGKKGHEREKGKEKGKGALNRIKESVPNGTSIYVRVALQQLNQVNLDLGTLLRELKLRKRKKM